MDSSSSTRAMLSFLVCGCLASCMAGGPVPEARIGDGEAHSMESETLLADGLVALSATSAAPASAESSSLLGEFSSHLEHAAAADPSFVSTALAEDDDDDSELLRLGIWAAYMNDDFIETTAYTADVELRISEGVGIGGFVDYTPVNDRWLAGILLHLHILLGLTVYGGPAWRHIEDNDGGGWDDDIAWRLGARWDFGLGPIVLSPFISVDFEDGGNQAYRVGGMLGLRLF